MKSGILTSKVHLSTVLLTILGTVDLLSTIAWLNLGGHEGNPLFNTILNHGVAPFALAKVAFLAGPIALLEFVRTKRPHSAEAGTWIAFAFYFGLWGTQIHNLGQALHVAIR
jgi:hypothetical protein